MSEKREKDKTESDLRKAPRDPGRKASRWVQRNDTRLKRTIDLLECNLGIPVHPGKRDALQVIVLTILSQNTTDPNALKAYENLMQAFPPDDYEHPEALNLPRDEEGNIDSVELRMSQVADVLPSPEWETIRTADSGQVEDPISVCGLQQSKAAAIQRMLDWVHERSDRYSLEDAVEGEESEEAMKLLSGVKGIGTKTAAVTLMEATQKDVCPVDTHVHRVLNRLRVVEPSKSRNKTFRELHEILPEGKGYGLHHNLLTFGRTICTARDPDCENCFLQNLCPHYRMEEKGEELILKFD